MSHLRRPVEGGIWDIAEEAVLTNLPARGILVVAVVVVVSAGRELSAESPAPSYDDRLRGPYTERRRRSWWWWRRWWW